MDILGSAVQLSGIEHSIIETLPDPFFIKDRDRRFLMVNEATARVFGLAKQDVLGKTNAEIFEGDILAQLERSDLHVLRTGRTVCVEEYVRHCDGQIRSYSTTKSPLRNGNAVVGVIGYAQDITERRHATDALRLALRAANAGTWDWIVGKELYWSAEFYELCGIDIETKPTLESWLAIVLPEDREHAQKVAQEAFAKRSPTYYEECRVRHPVRGVLWLAAQGTIYYNDDGSPYRMTGISYDITEKKLNEAVLGKALARARQAERTKTRFLAAASHDLRQPLQAAIFQAAALSAFVSDEGSEQLKLFNQSIDTLRGQLDIILDISHLDSDTYQPRTEDLPLDEIFNQVRAGLAGAAADKKLVLRVVHSGFWVRSDRKLLERILFNLVDNAIKYTDQGTVELDSVAAGGRITISVSDTGIGIAPRDQEEIWKEFRQLGNKERDRRRGLGLGLSIVRRLAMLLDHPLELESEPGRGSVFRLSVAAGTPQARRAEALSVQERTTSGRILIVDDDPLVLAALATVLRDHGHEVLPAANPKEAVDACQDRLSLIIADYRLPEVSGIAVIERVRAILGKSVPALLVTGDVASSIAGRAAKRGITVLRKPVSAEQLLRAAEQAMRG